MGILEYFRLDEEPFRLSPNPRFLYLNDQVKEAAAKVQFMTSHRTIMILRFQTKIDWLVRCKMRHAEKDTKALYGRL